MKKLTRVILVFLFIVAGSSFFSKYVAANSSDLQNDIILECVNFVPDNEDEQGMVYIPGHPKPVEEGTFVGTCSSETTCDIRVCDENGNCSPNNGLVRLSSGNNFFNKGAIAEKGQLINVPDHTGYYFYASHTSEPLGAGEGETVEEENSSQQLGQVSLVFPDVAGSIENCTLIYWDPYGRIFDSVSLEPFGEGLATVTLLDEFGVPSTHTYSNHVLIDGMGKYNIRIKKNGKYKLSVTPKTDHKFTANVPNGKYRDLYDFIYKLGDSAFVEYADQPKRVDAALTPIGEPYTQNPGYISREYLDVWYNGEIYTKIALRTVHPRTIVKLLVGGIELKENGDGDPLPKTSDKEGYWLVLIKKDILSQEGFSIELIKNPQYYPLANNSKDHDIGKLIKEVSSLIIKKVSAQQSITIGEPVTISPKKSNTTAVFKFEPILDYIEGFAYDNNSQIIPRAEVNIKLKMNNKIYSSITTDARGFFVMYPKNLPPYEYYLEIIDPVTGKVLKQTTSEFVKKNKTYLYSEDINLMKATKQDQKIIDPVTGKISNTPRNNNLSNQNNQSEPVVSTKTVFNKTILVIVLIIILLLVVTLSLVFYINKTRSFSP